MNECWLKDQDIESQRRRKKDPKDQEFTTTDSGTVAVQVGKSREEPGIKLQVVRGKEEKKKGHTGKGGWNVLVRWNFSAQCFARQRRSLASSIFKPVDIHTFLVG